MPVEGARLVIASDGVWDAFEKTSRVTAVHRSQTTQVPLLAAAVCTSDARHHVVPSGIFCCAVCAANSSAAIAAAQRRAVPL